MDEIRLASTINEVTVRHAKVTITISEDEAQIDDVIEAFHAAVKGLGFSKQDLEDWLGI